MTWLQKLDRCSAFVQGYGRHRWQVEVRKLPLGQSQNLSAVRLGMLMPVHLMSRFLGVGEVMGTPLQSNLRGRGAAGDHRFGQEYSAIAGGRYRILWPRRVATATLPCRLFGRAPELRRQ